MNSPLRPIYARTGFVWLTLSVLAGCSDASGTTDTVFPRGGSTATEGGSNNPAQGGTNNGNGGAQNGGSNNPAQGGTNNGNGGAQNGGSNNGNGGAQSGGFSFGNGGAQSGGNNSGRGGASGGFTFGNGGAAQGGSSLGRGGSNNAGSSNGGRSTGGTNSNSGGNGASGSASGGKNSGGASAGGVNSGGASAGAGGDPFAVAAKCTSGTTWTTGNGANMRPGEACVGCHRFTIAGTVYPTGHEPNDCNGVGTSAAATVVITDAKGTMLRLSVNSAGNFYSSTAITTPYTAVVQTSKGARAMTASQTNGNCNSCHTQNGSNAAPGRIVIP